MRKLAIVNQKGGSGKTTTAVNLAATLVEKGNKVLLIDLDPQASASLWYGFKDKGQGLFDLFTKEEPLETVIEKTAIEGLYLVPSSPLLAGIERTLTGLGVEYTLRKKVEMLPSYPWDYLLIDCPPNLGLISLNALTLADEVLIPVEAHVMALHGLVQLLKTIQLVKQKLNKELEILGILPCRVDYRNKHSKEVVEQLKSRFPGKVFSTCIRENIRLAEAPLHLKPIPLYDPHCKGTEDYRQLAEEIMLSSACSVAGASGGAILQR